MNNNSSKGKKVVDIVIYIEFLLFVCGIPVMQYFKHFKNAWVDSVSIFQYIAYFSLFRLFMYLWIFPLRNFFRGILDDGISYFIFHLVIPVAGIVENIILVKYTMWVWKTFDQMHTPGEYLFACMATIPAVAILCILIPYIPMLVSFSTTRFHR